MVLLSICLLLVRSLTESSSRFWKIVHLLKFMFWSSSSFLFRTFITPWSAFNFLYVKRQRRKWCGKWNFWQNSTTKTLFATTTRGSNARQQVCQHSFAFSKFSLGVNFTNVLRAAFTLTDPKSAKKLLNLTVFFALLGSTIAKAAHRTLVKLTPHLHSFRRSLT